MTVGRQSLANWTRKSLNVVTACFLSVECASINSSSPFTALYAKNLVYFTVPIADEDKIYVPPLEGFVMNRVLGDYFENLLYKIFVTIDAHTSVKDLASLLRQDPQLVKDAVSAYCRLGWVERLCQTSQLLNSQQV